MQDYCLDFESCKMAADQVSFLQGKLMPNLLSVGNQIWWSSLDIFLVP